MSSRENILAEIRRNKPAALPLPPPFPAAPETESCSQLFETVLTGMGGYVQRVKSWQDVLPYLHERVQHGVPVVSGLPQLTPYNIEDCRDKEAAELAHVHTVFLYGSLAVAENGAVWLTEADMVNRLLPFLCQELVLVVEEKSIVANLHEALERIQVDETGYGAFIAGPSKTADIEQSLVVGAHGPLKLQVLLVEA